MTKKIKKLVLVILIIFSFSIIQNSFAEDDCSDLEGDAKDQCKKLEKKAKVYEDLIKLKDKQQDTLAQQVDLINQEQEKNQLELAMTQGELAEVDKRISVLEEDIKEKEIVISTKKKLLHAFMQSYYEYDQQGILDIVVLEEDFSNLFQQTDYLEQSGSKVSDLLAELQRNKKKLVESSDELKKKRVESEELKDKLTDKKVILQTTENQKQSLLIQTQGEEAKYRNLLERVETQKKELFNFSEASNLDEVSASVSSYPKPKDNLASTSWYFSQKDSRWANTKIGNSSSLMKDYGCAVSCVSMVFRKNGVGIDPAKMAKQKIFYYDLIKWPGSWSPNINLASSVNHGNIKWATIDSQIQNGNPVIVYIKKTNGRGGHYVVITGKDKKDYIVHDPYFGPNLYLETSKSLVGKIGADSGTKVDQMIIYN